MSLLTDPAAFSSSRLFFAKLQPPRPPGRAVQRAHMIEPLLAAMPAGLILVTAPAGFGKSTLLCQIHDWLKSAGIPTGWVSLESADSEFGRFIAYLRAAVHAMLGKADDVGASSPGAGSPLAEAMELTELIAASDEPFALFLDDLHEIHNLDILAFLARVLSVLRAEQRVFIGTRELPALDLHRLRAYGKAVELDARKLRFTLDETQQFLAEAHLEALSDADRKFLHERTEGWPAALQLAALALAGGRERPQTLLDASLSASEIADYLAHEVFLRQPDEIRRFLTETSILPNFCAELCDAVTGRSDGREMIRRVEDANLFLAPIDHRRQWFRFHRMFAEFLSDQLAHGGAARTPELHRRAARWLVDDGRPGRAVDHALLAGDIELAARIMNTCAVDFVASSRFATLAQWAGVIPIDVLARNSELHSACVLALITLHRHAEARAMLAQFLGHGDAHDIRRSASAFAMQAFLTIWSDRLDELDDRVREALLREADMDALRLWTLHNCEAFMLMLKNDLARARRLFVTAKSMLQKIGARSSMVYSDAGVAMCDLLQGRVEATVADLERTLETWEPHGERFNTSNTIVAALLADAKYETRAITASRELVDIFLPLIEEGGHTEVLISSLRLRARIALMDGEADRAGKLLNQLESIGERRNLPRVVASAWLEKSRMALLAGNTGAARRHLDVATAAPCWTSPEFANTYANDFETPAIGALRLQVATGEPAAAIPQLEEHLAVALDTRRVMRALKLRILLAQALWSNRRNAEGIALLREALCDAAPERLVQAFADEAWALTPMLSEVSNSPGEAPPEFLNAVREACRIDVAPSAGRAPLPAVAGILSRREIEVLEMVAGGLSNKDMARKLFRSEATVATHLRNIYMKLEASGRMQAILKARDLGLLSR